MYFPIIEFWSFLHLLFDYHLVLGLLVPRLSSTILDRHPNSLYIPYSDILLKASYAIKYLVTIFISLANYIEQKIQSHSPRFDIYLKIIFIGVLRFIFRKADQFLN